MTFLVAGSSSVLFDLGLGGFVDSDKRDVKAEPNSSAVVGLFRSNYQRLPFNVDDRRKCEYLLTTGLFFPSLL